MSKLIQNQRRSMKVMGLVDLYADAILVSPENTLFFGSFWGNDTVIRELMAKLSLPVSQDGLDSLTVRTPDGELVVPIGRMDRIKHITAKTSSDTVFGSLCHLWIYDKRCSEPDVANRHAVLLHEPHEDLKIRDERLWRLIKSTCHLPLLDHWREPVIAHFRSASFLLEKRGQGIDGVFISLDENKIEDMIRDLVKSEILLLDENRGPFSQAMIDMFGEPVSVYTRKQAIEDGTLIDVSSIARDEGIKLPVVVTSKIWNDIIEVVVDDNLNPEIQIGQRLRKLLKDAEVAATFEKLRFDSAVDFNFEFLTTETNGDMCTLSQDCCIHFGGGDYGEPVLTIK